METGGLCSPSRSLDRAGRFLDTISLCISDYSQVDGPQPCLPFLSCSPSEPAVCWPSSATPENVFTPFTSCQSLFSVLSLSSRSWISSFHPHDPYPHGRWTSAARKLALPGSQAAALSQLQDWGLSLPKRPNPGCLARLPNVRLAALHSSLRLKPRTVCRACLSWWSGSPEPCGGGGFGPKEHVRQ